MLERIAVALEIDPPALFTTEIRPVTEAEVLMKVHKEILGDFTRLVTYRMKQLGQAPPPPPRPQRRKRAYHSLIPGVKMPVAVYPDAELVNRNAGLVNLDGIQVYLNVDWVYQNF
ncbi:MAG: hypothetical protein LBF83_04095 [Spirochaetaceae bacterium]|jgi:hypothetical protein|nr:hypothetical protein [Spirochaetaceae bacterium]